MVKRDLSGQRFGALTVLQEADQPYISPSGKKTRRWVCRCDCGKELTILQNALTGKHGTHSCGCSRRASLQIDMTSQRYGRLTVIRSAELEHSYANGQRTGWLCRCDCGKEIVLPRKDLLSGKVLSCGCLLRDASRSRIVDQNILGDVLGTRLSAIQPNRPANRNSKSGHKGVYWSECEQRWIAKLGFRGKTITLGRFRSIDAAVKARTAAEKEYYAPLLKENHHD